MDENVKEITERQIWKTASEILDAFGIEKNHGNIFICEDRIRNGFKELLDTVLHGDR